MDVEIIARVCHEAIRAFCESNGDFSIKKWEESEEWQKESTIKGVFYALKKEATAATQHEEWMKEKLQEGWNYGEVKDAEKKIHPALVPFEKLSAIEKTKDFLFLSIVNALKQAPHSGILEVE